MAGKSKGTDDLAREVEETRLRLASTIDQLTVRAHPKNIVKRQIAATKARFVGPDGPRFENIVPVAGAVLGGIALIVGIRYLVGRD